MRRRLLAAALLAAGGLLTYAVYVVAGLPSRDEVRVLARRNPGKTALMRQREEEARARGRRPRSVQSWIPLERVSRNLIQAVIASEDQRFFGHEGVDWEAVQESVEANVKKRRAARGGSTITQQLAKNLYLSPSKNPLRKIRELFIARRLEAELGKTRILELYLNVIEWGDGVYGVEAAARTYFGVSAGDLGPPQAALLAGAIINPRTYSPARPTARLRARQQLILRRMGSVTPPPALPAVAPVPAPLVPVPLTPFDPSILPGAAPPRGRGGG